MLNSFSHDQTVLQRQYFSNGKTQIKHLIHSEIWKQIALFFEDLRVNPYRTKEIHGIECFS